MPPMIFYIKVDHLLLVVFLKMIYKILRWIQMVCVWFDIVTGFDPGCHVTAVPEADRPSQTLLS